MFESQVAYYLNNYLGKYVYGLDAQSLKVSVFQGDVVLRNLKLKPEALEQLDLPITVKSGLLGSLTLKVPWASLGRSPVLVEVDRLYILAGPKEDKADDGSPEDGTEDLDAAERALKRRRVHDAEVAWTSEKFKLDKDKAPAGGGRFRAIIDTVIGNLQLSITNVHIRFEEDGGSPGPPMAFGVTLEKLTAHTVDEDGKQTFAKHNPMELLRKGSQLQRLAVYFDVGRDLWKPPGEWTNMDLEQWDRLFQPGISAGESAKGVEPPQAYILQPVGGRLTYLRRGPNVRTEESQAVQEADVKLDTVTLQITKGQYQSLQDLLQQFSTFAARRPNSHLRPKSRPRNRASVVRWWHYAAAASRRTSTPPSLTWQRLSLVVGLRKKYVPAYVECLHNNNMGGDAGIEEMDAQLPEHTILVFRRLAHAKVEKEKRRAAAQAAAEYKKAKQEQGWVGWLLGGAGLRGGGPPAAPTDEDGLRGDLNEEEYAKLEEIVSEQEAAVSQGKEGPHSLQMEVRLEVGSSSLVLEGQDGVHVAKGGLEGLNLTARKFPVTLAVAVTLDGVGVLSPEGVILSAGQELQQADSEEALDSGVPEVSTARSRAERQAMEVEFTLKPQDGKADTQLDVALAPSYIVYNPLTLQRVADFFHTAQAVDFSALSAQAVARVERARQAAQQQIAAAFQEKPKLALRVRLEAPKIAIPVPSTFDDEGKLTLVADLGTFLLETDTATAARLTPEEAALYECVQLVGSDISAYLVDGDFSFSDLEKRLDGGSNIDLATAESGASLYIPLLERTGMTAAVQAARFPYPKLPKLRSQLTLPALRFYFSPARVRRIMRVVRSALPEKPEQEEDPQEALARAVWRTQAEFEGPLRVLAWGGLGYTQVEWHRQYGVVHAGQLYLLDAKMSLAPLATHNLYLNRKIVAMPKEHVGGVEHVIAICPPDVETSQAAQGKECTLLRLKSKEQALVWKNHLSKSAERMRELAGGDEDGKTLAIDLDDDTASLASSISQRELNRVASNLGQQDGQGPQAPMEVKVQLEELALYVSGRPCTAWWPPEKEEVGAGAPEATEKGSLEGGVVNVDGEQSLLVVRASAGSADASVGGPHLFSSVAIGRFEIEDLLVGSRCRAHRYLARSFEATSAGDEDEDHFEDANEELSVRSQSGSSARSEIFQDAVSSPESISRQGVAATPKAAPSLVLEFQTWQPGSAEYANVDAELAVRITALHFFGNRPTIGALMGMGGDLGDAFKGPQTPTPGNSTGGQQPTSAEEDAAGTPEDESRSEPSDDASVGGGNLTLEGGNARTVFRLQVEVEKLVASLLYEEAGIPPLALAQIEDVRFSLKVHPSTLTLTTALGNLKAQDGRLPEGHPFRNVCDLKRDATSSLIELEYTTHTAEEAETNERVPSGMPYASVNAHMQRLDVIFLSRFLFEILRYISLLTAMQPQPLSEAAESTPEQAKSEGQSKVKQEGEKMGPILELNVSMDAPNITMPRNGDSADAIHLDLGSLSLNNAVAWRTGSSVKDPEAVLMEEDVITLEGLGATVSVDGRRGANIIREYDSGTTIRLHRALRDLQQLLPKTAVAVEVPSIKASLSDQEYQLITSIAGDNFNEPQQLPPSALWLERHHLRSDDVEEGGIGTIEEGDEEAGEDGVPPQVAMDRAVATVRPEKAAPVQQEAETSLRVTVEVRKAELELLHTTNQATAELAPLGRFTIRKLWLAFRSMEGGRQGLSLSLPFVEGADMRPGLPDEHRLIISAAAAADETAAEEDVEDDVNEYKACASFLTMEFQTDPRLATQKLQVRLQRPTITAEVSFMLAVAKFFVPGVALSGAKPIPFQSFDLRLEGPQHKAEGHTWLCPETRLLADSLEVDSYVFDGQGHRLILPEAIATAEQLPLVVVGTGKTLKLCNVTIVHAESLAACLQLAPGARLVAESGDNVTMMEGPDPALASELDNQDIGYNSLQLGGRPAKGSSPAKPARGGRSSGQYGRSLGRRSTGRAASQGNKSTSASATSLKLDFVALGVGLRFLELAEPEEAQQKATPAANAKGSAVSVKPEAAEKQYLVRMLAAYLDLSGSLAMEGESLEVAANLKGLRLETLIELEKENIAGSISPKRGSQVRGMVLEPATVAVKVTMQGPSGNLNLDVSNIRLNLSPDILELAMSLQSSVLEPLIQPPAEQPLSKCTSFVKVWSSGKKEGYTEAVLDTDVLGAAGGLTFWRPLPAVGYAVFGDCATAGTSQPAFQVLSVAVNSGLVTFPTGYKRVGYAKDLTVWAPQPPKGYVALGHVVTHGEEEPPIKQVVCLHESRAVAAPLGECLQVREGDGESAKSPGDLNVWNLDNAGATFMVCAASEGSPAGPFLTVRSPLGVTPAMLAKEPQAPKPTSPRSPPQLASRSYKRFSKTRKDLMKASSKARLQSRAVEFRRVWSDKNVKASTRLGMSIWKPLAPPGYVSLGDCIVSGYDPPTFATMLQRQSGDLEAIPLLRPPQDFQLVWRDDNTPGNRALHIWKPIPMPGYITLGCIAGIGEAKPSKLTVRCVRANGVKARSSTGRPITSLPPVGRRTGFKAWATDERLGTFVLTRGEEPPMRDDLCHLTVLEDDDGAGETNTERKEGLNMVVKTGHTSLLLRDALRRPLAEVELGAIQASLRRPTEAVMQFYCGIHISAWSYNPTIAAWEPVLESWDLIVKVDANKGAQASQGVDSGTHVSVKSTSEIVHVTLSYAAATHALTSLLEWRDLASGAAGSTFKRQLAAADSSSVHTLVRNRLGVPARLQLDFGNRLASSDLPEGRSTPVLQPLSRSPSRYSEDDNVGPSPEAFLPPMLFLDLRNAIGVKGLLEAAASPLATQELFLTAALATKGGDPSPGASWGLRSRAVAPNKDKDKLKWHERLVMELPKDKGEVVLDLQLWDAAADAGKGVQLADGSINLQWADWQQGAIHRHTVHLQGTGEYKAHALELSTRLTVVRMTGRGEGDGDEPTDKWTAEESTAGQRAIHLGKHHRGWAVVPPTGLQRSAAVANKHLKQNIAGKEDTGTPASASLSVVRIGSADGLVIESNFKEGVKQETLRSLCQVANGTLLPLEVALVGGGEEWEEVASQRPSLSPPASSATANVQAPVEEEVFENERYIPIRGWSSRNLTPLDRRRFSRGRDQPAADSTAEFPRIPLPNGWEWEKPWELETSGYTDKEGWSYGVDFGSLQYPPAPGSQKKAMQHFVRRRRYYRVRRQAAPQASTSSPGGNRETAASGEQGGVDRQVLGVVEPGESLPMPFGWRIGGKQVQVRPVLDAGGGRSHGWSRMVGGGGQGMQLDSLEEGGRRLAACSPLADPPNKDAGSGSGSDWAARLSAAQVWLSLTVEGEPLTDDAGEPLTDWRIVALPPLVVQNQLPVTASLLVWEEPQDGGNMVLRQSGEVESGHPEHIYAVNTQCSVRLQFYPQGYEWSEADPILISQGHSRDGNRGRLVLPDKFQVTNSNGHDNSQEIFVNREINMHTWMLDDQESNKDPSALVASGTPILVRVFVPLWLVNATTLPVSALVVETVPPPKPSKEGEAAAGQLLDASESIKPKVMDAKIRPSGGRIPVGTRQVMAGSVAMLTFPQTQLQAFKDGDRKHYGLRLKAGDSGWTEPLPLDSTAAASTGEASSKPVVIRAEIPEWGTVHEIVARLDLVGSGFERTQVMRLESYCVVSNRTGIPLQLLQCHRGVTAETYDDGAGGGTLVDGGKAGLPRRTQDTPVQPGLQAAIRDPGVDWTSCMDIPIGTIGSPMFWSLQSPSRSVCIRFSPDGTDDGTTRWSHPVEVEVAGNTRKFLAVPMRRRQGVGKGAGSGPSHLRSMTTLRRPSVPCWNIRDGRVADQGPAASGEASGSVGGGEEQVEVVILRYSLELRSPGCMHFVLESVAANPPFLLENRSQQPLRYRQGRVPGLPFVDLPAYSAAGFAWPVPERFKAEPRALQGSSRALDLDSEPNEVELADFTGRKEGGKLYVLDPSVAAKMKEDATATAQHATTSAELESLPIGNGKPLQVAVHDIHSEVMARAGLQSLGVASGMGRGGQNRALRLTPATNDPASTSPADSQSVGNALYLGVTISALDLSLVDHTPEEILLATATGISAEWAAGIGPGASFTSMRLSVNGLQIDDQLSTSRFPVVLTPASMESEEGGVAQPLLQARFTCQPAGAQGQVYYPYLAFRVSKPLQVAVTETLVWRVVEMVERLDLGAVAGGGAEGGSVRTTSDVPLRITLVNMSDLAAFVSFRGDTLSRPRWAAAMSTLSWGLDMANFEAVPVRLQGFEMQNVTMLSSVFLNHVLGLIKGQITTVALTFLRNFGLSFSGASGVLGALSAGVGSLAGEDEKERQRERREREITGVGSMMAEGGNSIATGFKRGFTGLVNKPVQGAKQAGVGGFVSGIGKGLVGAVANPLSGGLDALSTTFEGFDAASSSLLGRARPQAAKRSRLPRAIGGDHRLLPFTRSSGSSETEARIEEVGQSLLRKARDRDTSTLSLIKRKRRRSSRTQDSYEDHFLLLEDRVVVLTNCAMVCLVAPGFAAVHAAAQRGDSAGAAPEVPEAEIRWSVLWKDLLALELVKSRKELAVADRVQVQRKGRPGEADEEALAHELRCFPNSSQAAAIKMVAMRVRDKFYVGPHTKSESWERRSAENSHKDAEYDAPQKLPPVMPSLEFRRLWRAERGGGSGVVSIWRPVGPPGYKPLGDVISHGLDPPSNPVEVYRHSEEDGQQNLGNQATPPERAPPKEFHLVWRGLGRNAVSIWAPIPQPGYRAMGAVATPGAETPSVRDVLCVRESAARPAAIYDSAIFSWEPPAGGLALQRTKPYYPQTWKCSLWQVDNKHCTFLAVRTLQPPPEGSARSYES